MNTFCGKFAYMCQILGSIIKGSKNEMRERKDKERGRIGQSCCDEEAVLDKVGKLEKLDK